MENRDGVEFSHGLKRRAQIGFVTFGIRRREGHIDVQTGFLRGAQRGKPLRWRGCSRLIHLGQIVAQCGQAHAENQALAEAAEQLFRVTRRRSLKGRGYARA